MGGGGGCPHLFPTSSIFYHRPYIYGIFYSCNFFFSLSFFLSFIFFYPSLEKGQLFCPQNSKTHCSHLFFLTWSSDQFSNLLKDVVKIKSVSSWKKNMKFGQKKSRDVDFQNAEKQSNKSWRLTLEEFLVLQLEGIFAAEASTCITLNLASCSPFIYLWHLCNN